MSHGAEDWPILAALRVPAFVAPPVAWKQLEVVSNSMIPYVVYRWRLVTTYPLCVPQNGECWISVPLAPPIPKFQLFSAGHRVLKERSNGAVFAIEPCTAICCSGLFSFSLRPFSLNLWTRPCGTLLQNPPNCSDDASDWFDRIRRSSGETSKCSDPQFITWDSSGRRRL